MKIMTYNIWTGGFYRENKPKEIADPSRIKFIKEVIREASKDEPLDFLGMQEAQNFYQENYKLLNEMSECANLENKLLAFAPENYRGERYPVASFSRNPFKDEEHFAGQLKLSGLCTLIDSEFGEIAVCNVHLYVDSDESGVLSDSEDIRIAEISTILDYVKNHDQAIILGDHNALSKKDNYNIAELEVDKRFDVIDKMLESGFVDVAYEAGINDISTWPSACNTNPAFSKPVRIDYIFTSPNLSKHIKDVRVIKTEAAEQASDHYPVLLTLE